MQLTLYEHTPYLQEQPREGGLLSALSISASYLLARQVAISTDN